MRACDCSYASWMFFATGPHAQVEADIRPFRGLLLGLFFVTTGASLDVGLLLREWEIVVALLVGLIAVKILIIGSIAPFFGLNRCAAGMRQALQALYGDSGRCTWMVWRLTSFWVSRDFSAWPMCFIGVAGFLGHSSETLYSSWLGSPSRIPATYSGIVAYIEPLLWLLRKPALRMDGAHACVLNSRLFADIG